MFSSLTIFNTTCVLLSNYDIIIRENFAWEMLLYHSAKLTTSVSVDYFVCRV